MRIQEEKTTAKHANKYGKYTEDSAEYKEVVDRLKLKWKSAADHVPAPITHMASETTKYGIISLGSCDGAVQEARDRLQNDGIYLNYLLICKLVNKFVDILI